MFRADQEIGPYILIKRIGRGSFGEVWLAERRAKFVTTKVAVKLPLEEQVDAEAIKSEAVLWEQASGHPNILPIIDADEYDGQIVIVSEYAPDGSLSELLQSENKLSVKRAVEITIGILSGLEFLHSKKIIHRDLKPANILLQGETPRLADFGISRVIKTTSVSSNISGTPGYMAPEAFDRRRSIQTDIWSVGVISYQMLMGRLPFPGNNLTDLFGAIVRDEPKPFSKSVAPNLQQIVLRALAKKPAERYSTAREMREDCFDFLISISKQSIQPTLEDEQLLPTLADDQLVQTIDYPEMHGSIPVSTTAGKELAVTRQSSEILELEKNKPQVHKTNSNYLKILAPIVALLLFCAIGGYFLWKTFVADHNISANLKDVQLIPYLKGDKFGFCDANKKLIIEAKYDYVGPFSEGLAVINLGRKFDSSGTSAAKYAIKGKYGVIDQTGREIVPPRYDRLTDFADGIAIMNIGWEWKDGKAIAWGKFGLIDKSGNEIIPPTYDLIGKFSEGLAKVELNNKVGFIDKTGNLVVPIVYGDAGEFSDQLAAVNNGKMIRGISKDGLGFLQSVATAGKWGFIDMSGKESISAKFDYAESFSEGLATVDLKDKCGYIDRIGKFQIPAKYDGCTSFSEGLAGVRVKDKWGFIDKNGNAVIPPKYDSVQEFSEGLAPVNIGQSYDEANRSEGKWGFINKTGKEIVPIKYDRVSKYDQGLAVVNSGYYWNTSTSKVISEGKLGFIDKFGEEVISLKYDNWRSEFVNNFAWVTIENRSFYIDKNGIEYYER